MSKASKKAGQSSSYNSTEVGTNSHKTQLDGPSKSISARKKKDGGGAKKKQNLSKKELKELEKQQRQKAYVAPTKPQPIRPDPLDSTGLAYVLPGELVIVLRNLGKKAVKTREKALDELDTGWVNSDRGKGKEAQEQILMDMLPIWLSHLPQLLLHASKRIRLVTASVHRSFISIPAVSGQIKLQLETDSAESADAIGTWSLATNDVDPVVANVAAESWRQFARTSPSLLCREQITIYAQRAILDPGGLYAYLNPAPPSPSVSTPTLSHKEKLRLTQKNDTSDLPQPQGFDGLQSDSLETDTDRDARIRVAGIGSLALFVSNSSLSITSVAAVWDILGDARLWSSLVGNDPESFGFEQPPVRKVAWRLVGVVSGALGMVSRLLRILSFSVFHSAWNEQDVGVQGVMWPSLLRFLKDNPEAWQWEIENTASQMNVPRQSKDVDAELESGSESEIDFPDAENQDVAGKTTVSSPAASRAYQSLLSFLERGCNGSPIQAYPAIVIILSTIPSSILLASYSSKSRPLHSLPFNDLFSSFWAAVASTTITPNRLFSGSGADKAAKAFIETVLECLVFLVRRTVSQSQNGSSEMKVETAGLSTLIKTQIKRIWEEVVGITGSSTTKDSNGEAKKLVLKLSPDVLDCAGNVASGSSAASRSANDLSSFISSVLKALNSESVDSSDPTSSDAHQLLEDVFSLALDGCERILADVGSEGFGSLYLLTRLINAFGSDSTIGASNIIQHSVTTRIDTLLIQNAYKLLSLPSEVGLFWLALLEQVVEQSHSHPDLEKVEVLQRLISLLNLLKSKRGGMEVVFRLKPITGELDEMVLDFARDTVTPGSSSSGLNIVRDVLLLTHRTTIGEEISHPLITIASLVKLIDVLISRFEDGVESLLGTSAEGGNRLEDQQEEEGSITLDRIDRLLVLMEVILNLPPVKPVDPESSKTSSSTTLLPALPSISIIPDIVAVFYVLRDSITAQASKEYLNSTLSMMNPVESLLPSQTSFDALLDQLNGAPISRSIGVVDELAGIASLFGSSTVTSNPDHTHAYARYALALLRIVSDDLRLARGLLTTSSSSWWVLRHLLVLGVYAEEVVMVPSAHETNPLFHLGMNQPGRVRRCRELIAKVHQIVAYVFASVESTEGEREWRKDLFHILSASTDTFMPTLPSVGSLLLSSIRFAAKIDSYRDCCVLGEVLSRVFQAGFGSVSTDGISEEESNSWLNYARKMSEFKKGESAPAPLTGITIMSTLVANLPSSSSTTSSSFLRLDRYRNELASSLLGVPSSRAASDGLRILLTLVLGTAPDVESEAVFLPVQRAVNVIKACQKWIEEEEENGEEENNEGETGVKMEELESAMTLTFYHLAPILQNVPGGHWQFIFDVIENNIESLSVSHSSSPLQLLTLARTLRLIGHVQDLAATNKSLRAEWNERKDGIMKSIKSMILDGDFADEESEAAKGEGDHGIKSSDEPNSVPESVCRELVLELMCHLLSSSTSRSSDITSFSSSLSHPSSSSLLCLSSPIHHAQLAFQILHKAAKKCTEHFVLEAGVDTEGKLEAQLPRELMVLLQQSVNLDIDADDANLTGGREHAVFVYLLGWMLLFDLFVDTSMKVRMRYIDQLRNSSIIEEHFIPTVFSLLRLDRGIVKAYKLDMWAVNEFYSNSCHSSVFEAGSSSGLQNFAAHLYYRALLTVPSLIYNWVVNCRDRQLSSTIAAYTQSHFSPVLIRAELEHVKSPEAQSEFASDENPLSVKVASGAVNEVTASYLVDEQQLEIRLRIPGDWPLHRIEIRDTKKVGVDDNRWRAWILGVQQTIWAQNGRIVDGLTLFKKNVTGHFEGQVECAICYSLINVNDGSLPKKPCNTCKNRFHAGCLYKWFNSSHSSSCPLCRSDILH
ncbi:hypothetical protein DFJ43DRAFT_1005337 [Lentinula guzmanii]|uniref:E3 ubiquitin-protein ligase listerin n=1 Tax=Lentinula guzmanii TaxID=2804957 RepID=A0AA38JFK0_9AGAR|nr:hypothetical protein DFJ43DRAFT_1005337 [Lentinula guzmanii]